MSWQQDTAYVDPDTVKIWITVTAGLEWSFFYPGAGAHPPVGTTIPTGVVLQLTGSAYSNAFVLPVVVQSVLPSDDLLFASASVALIIPRSAFPLTAQWADCCRADTLAERNNDLNFSLATLIDVNPASGATRSPVATVPLRVRMPLGAASTFQLPSIAFEGFTNTFRFAPAGTSGLQTPRPNGTVFCTTGQCTDLNSPSPPYSLGMQLSAAGVITWLPHLSGLYAAQFTITSIDANGVPRASVPLDMEFEVLVLCAPGTYSATGAPPCNPAPAGSFVSGYGNTSAFPCPAGTFSSVAGAEACTSAPLGYYVALSGSTSATACPAGTFSAVIGAVACTPAPFGYYVSAPGSSAPTPCPPGTFNGETGALACTLAPAGSFASGTGNTSATLCPAGTFSGFAGAAACTPAPPGSYVSAAGSTSATACPAGTFSAATGAVACTAAPIGSYVDSPGSSSPTPCLPGTFSSVLGAAACTPAPPGYYVSAPGSTEPTACPAGTWSAGGAPACTSVKVLLDRAVRAYLGDTGAATSLCRQIESIASAPNGIAKAGKRGAFINHLNALRGTALTPEQADDLTAFANLL